MSNTGEVEARELGQTRVKGMIMGHDSDDGVIAYSTDDITITVTQLDNIRITSPLKRLLVDTEACFVYCSTLVCLPVKCLSFTTRVSWSLQLPSRFKIY